MAGKSIKRNKSISKKVKKFNDKSCKRTKCKGRCTYKSKRKIKCSKKCNCKMVKNVCVCLKKMRNNSKKRKTKKKSSRKKRSKGLLTKLNKYNPLTLFKGGG
tara:strand:- start:2012 stop:2317 length:306 start_codon:yes stop_codon:yes gene_type:complete